MVNAMLQAKNLRPIVLALPLGLAALGLVGCGVTPSQRALSGAGIGAATGAVGAALTGGSVGTGAVIGGAVGAAAGALTKRHQLHVGD